MELTYTQKQRDIDFFRKELNHGDVVYYAEKTDSEKGYYVQTAVFEERAYLLNRWLFCLQCRKYFKNKKWNTINLEVI